jgi:hypothetical protein
MHIVLKDNNVDITASKGSQESSTLPQKNKKEDRFLIAIIEQVQHFDRFPIMRNSKIQITKLDAA